MKKLLNLTGMVMAALVTQSALADAHEKAAPMYVYGTYFYCDVQGEDAADATVKRRFAPIYEKAMKEGMITGWGYLKHHTGGKWRRLTYHMGPGVIDVIKASEWMNEMRTKEWTEEDGAFGRACKAHDDYIWQSKAGNVGEKRGKVGMSVYFKCDMSKEERADEIVAKVFAPIYDAHLGEGKLTSWGWMSHVVGGSYRRISTMTAENIETLMKMRAQILGMDIPEGQEFVKICGSHTDYIWTIDMEGR